MEIERWKERFLRIETSGIKLGNTIWASELKRNGLYNINLEKEKIEFVGRFPIEEGDWQFLNIVSEEANLFFVPYMASELVIYNINTKSFYTLDVKRGYEERYGFGCIYAGNIYLFPDVGSRIAKVDIRSEKVTYIEDVITKLKNDLSIDHLFFSHYLYKEEIYMPLFHKSIVVVFDLKMENYRTYGIGEYENIGIMDCLGVNEVLFLLDRLGTVYEFNLHTKSIQTVFSMQDGTMDPYCAVRLYKSELWLIPFKKKQLVIYNMKNGEKTILNISLEKIRSDKYREQFDKDNRLMFSKVFVEDEKLWMYPKETEWVVEVDMKTRKMNGFQARLPLERNWSLSGYIARGGEMSLEVGNVKNTCGDIGKNIYLAVNEL